MKQPIDNPCAICGRPVPQAVIDAGIRKTNVCFTCLQNRHMNQKKRMCPN